MGRKTYESLGKPLPNRTNIIVSRNPNFKAEGCIVVSSLKEALAKAKADPNPYILGGAQIYKQALFVADRMDLTLIHEDFEADAFFPEFSEDHWVETGRQDILLTDKELEAA